ncbi:hypothetical protein RhiirA1_469065 [Rhizophagus irregularis]|uniref:Uncharacterized protein n=1 Tax=Rhizophagus irregularis TaxID=588596 RepID=A0A2N0R8V5_9GLOM|nr:hypothetical protein RhiirA1_469065 [Rhizophagus irregularis]
MSLTPALENDGKSSFKFTVLIETPSKPFNEWTFLKVCKFYGLSDDPNPSIDVYSVFSCSCADTKDEKYKKASRKLFVKLETRAAITPMRPQKASIYIVD